MNANENRSLAIPALCGVVCVLAIVVGLYVWRGNREASPGDTKKSLADNKKDAAAKDPLRTSNDKPELKIFPVAYEAPSVSLAAATEFLHSGPAPVQVNMDPKILDAKRAAALRGVVFKEEKEPFAGVHVSIQNQPRYGVGKSRPDGSFDMVVNGGGLMTVGFTYEDYLPVWRQTAVPWQDYVWLPSVVMTRADSKVTPVKSDDKALQVARASIVKDKDGQRQTTLIFQSGTKATMVLPNGATKPLTELHVRATEYTVGAKGPARMPAPLPPASGYTYCVELNADEAIKAGARSVKFDKPVYHYVENFLNFPVGIAVPTGYFDPEKAAWIASESGRVIKIIQVKADLAVLDVEGKGQAADDKALKALNLGDDERKELARIYAVGVTLWRVPIPHFSIWDCNWPFSPPADAAGPSVPPPHPAKRDDGNKAVRKSVQPPNLPWKLHYNSDRTPGAEPPRTLGIPVSGKSIPKSLKRIELEIFVAGRLIEVQLPAKPDQTHTFIWDGKDAYGRLLQGAQCVKVRIGYCYDGVYEQTSRFGYNGGGMVITGSRTRQEVVLWQEQLVVINFFDARCFGLGGWSCDVQHAYDPVGRILYLGNGDCVGDSADGPQAANLAISTVAGGGVGKDLGDGGPALLARLDNPGASPGAGIPRNRQAADTRGLAIGPDGTLYVADDNNRIRRVDPDGKISTIAGGGGKDADSGRAADLRLHHPTAIALGPDGSLFFTEAWYGDAHRVRRLDPDGTLSTIAGGSARGSDGDGGPALKAKLSDPTGLAVAPDGTIYIADQSNHRIRCISPDGVISTFAGAGMRGYGGDNGPATKAELYWPTNLAIAPDGSLFFSDQGNYVIRRISPSGIITTVAGTFLKDYSREFGGDDGPALKAKFNDPTGIAVAADGSLIIADTMNYRLRRVGPDGIIRTLAGPDPANALKDFTGDGGPARLAKLFNPTGVAFGPDGSVYVHDGKRVRRITPPMPGFSDTQIAVPARDGKELYKFNAVGRHLETIDAATNKWKRRFAYDKADRLAKIEDAEGTVVTIERDAKGWLKAIAPSQGQKIAVELDANGYLERLTSPDAEPIRMTYGPGGMLKER